MDLDLVREAHLELVAGEVSVGGTASPSRLEVTCLGGSPVEMSLDDGVLILRQGPSLLTPVDRASVALTVPPDTPLRVRTVSAGTLVAGLAADCRVWTVSGEVTGSFLAGDITVSTVSGDIGIEGITGRLQLSSVSGDATVTAASLHGLTAKTMSGEVTVDLDPKDDGVYECRTLSGTASFRLPPEAGLDVEVLTVSGRLVADAAESRHGLPVRRRWQVGDGGPQLTVRTISGDVVVLRRVEAVMV
jgi:hypothetical protein